MDSQSAKKVTDRKVDPVEVSKENFLLKFGILSLFILLLISGIYLFVKGKMVRTSQTNPALIDTKTSVNKDNEVDWQTYTNEEFGYYLKHPPLLYKRDLGSAGGYIDFIRFEENQFSTGHGLAVGVRETNLLEETENIKKEFDQLGGAKLVEETKISVNGIEGVRLLYKPQNDKDGENRVIVILNNSKYSYSISTVPEQINKVLTEFGFIE